MDTNMKTKELLEKVQAQERMILYNEAVNGKQTFRDDLWAISTEELKELEASIRKELLVELKEFMTLENGQNIALTPFGVESFALSKGITLQEYVHTNTKMEL